MKFVILSKTKMYKCTRYKLKSKFKELVQSHLLITAIVVQLFFSQNTEICLLKKYKSQVLCSINCDSLFTI